MIKVIIKVGLNQNKKEKEGEEILESEQYLNKDILLFLSANYSNLIWLKGLFFCKVYILNIMHFF